METVPAGSQVGAGESFKGKPGSVCAAPDGDGGWRHSNGLHRFFGFFYNMKMLFYDLQHIPVAFREGQGYRVLAIFFLNLTLHATQEIKTLFKAVCIVVADNIMQL